jgi:hypothetical protein
MNIGQFFLTNFLAVKYRQRTRPLSRDSARDPIHLHARQQWKLATEVALRAGSDDTSDTSGDENMTSEELEEYRQKKLRAKHERERTAKMMDLQYFLEMVDTKHRYGSNLRAYHNEWKKLDTHENFFHWLDEGGGRNIELPTVSRQRLENEQVRYLSREERQNYLVNVDPEGRLCWAKNGERISTTTEYKDSVDGVVPLSDTTSPTWSAHATNEKPVLPDTGSATSRSSISSSVAEDEGEHYVNNDLVKAKGLAKLKHVSAAVILNQLLQKTANPNSWIFVTDTSFRLYVGIKRSGAFQHSSFLHGARISAAGLIKINDGQLRRLSPLSGHYRPPTRNFRLFIQSLQASQVDMSHVSISRSYAVLVGLEAYVRTRTKLKHGVEHVKEEKDKILHPDEAKKREERRMDNSKSAQRERHLLEEERKQEELEKKKMPITERLKKKLHIKGDGSTDGKPAAQAPTVPLSVPGEDVEDGIPPDGTRT